MRRLRRDRNRGPAMHPMISHMIRAVTAVAVLTLASALPASAQNRDGDIQLRFGAFLMFANASADLTTTTGALVREDSQSKSVWGGGVQSGIEWVRQIGRAHV